MRSPFHTWRWWRIRELDKDAASALEKAWDEFWYQRRKMDLIYIDVTCANPMCCPDRYFRCANHKVW